MEPEIPGTQEKSVDTTQVGPFAPPLARRVPFDFAEPCPPYWMGYSYSASCLLDAYTMAFPAMEAYMVKQTAALVRRRSEVAFDHAAIRGFLEQEGAHAREHRRSVASVEAQGFDVARASARIDRLFGLVERTTELLLRLPYGDAIVAGIMAGGEHWTASMAEMSFTPGMLASTVGQVDGAEAPRPISDMEILYLWHCAEELEHKAVAADILAALEGGEAIRLISFTMATALFFGLSIATFVPLWRQAPRVLGPDIWAWVGGPGGWRGLAREARISLAPLGTAYGKAIRRYLRRHFHPNDVETDLLVEKAFRRLAELRQVAAA